MYSIHNHLACAIVLAGLFVGGCQQITNTPPEPINTTPLVIDEAMQRRDWPPSSAYYADGGSVAGPVGFWFEPRTDAGMLEQLFVPAPLSVAQIIALPVTMWLPPLWTPIMYRGQTVDPTYTAVPPIP